MAMTRSENMARIRGSNTKPEIRLRRALWSAGLRYRLFITTPAGRPDIVFPSRKIAIFVDGCQWHGCPEHYVRPRTREEFWGSKLAENVQRDRRQTLTLEAAGWQVCRFWEHEVATQLEKVVARIRATVEGQPRGEERRYCVVKVEPLGLKDQEARYMEDLRDPTIERRVEKARSTRKW